MALGEEAEAFRSMQAAVQSGQGVPLIEAEAVVWSLAVAMHGQQRIVMPLLQLKEFDQYTTAHSLNVSVLSMALAEALGYGAKQVRAVGVAGLLHDIGKVSIPIEVLTKPGKLTDEERLLMNQHPVEGARIILQSGDEMELAAVVAYEHHIMLNGGGYPSCTTSARVERPVGSSMSATSTTPCARGVRIERPGRRRKPSAIWNRWPARSSTPTSSRHSFGRCARGTHR